MDIMQFVKAGLVLGFVGVIQIIKALVDQARAKKAQTPIDGTVWIVVVAVSGIIMSVISAGIDQTWDVWIIVQGSFIYAAAASYVYQVGKAAAGK